MRHNTARADHRTVTDRDTREDDASRSDPHIIADGDGSDGFPITFFAGVETVLGVKDAALLRNKRMVDGCDRDIGSEHHVVTDSDFGIIHHYTVVVGKEVLADVDVTAVTAMKRDLHQIGTAVNRTEQAAK